MAADRKQIFNDMEHRLFAANDLIEILKILKEDEQAQTHPLSRSALNYVAIRLEGAGNNVAANLIRNIMKSRRS